MSTLRVTNIQDLAGNSVFVLSGGNATIAGDLTVQGTTTSIETTNLTVKDKNIVLGLIDPAATDATADGGGITLKGTTDKTIAWADGTDAWTSSERFSVPLGSAGAPSLTFTGDPNTGIYSPGADQLALATGGTGRLFVDATGNVGVGIGTPTASLHVDSNVNPTIRIEDQGEYLDLGYNDNSSTLSIGVINADNGNTSVADTELRIGVDGASRYVIKADGSHTFYQTNGSTESLKITSDGKLGLGTSSPDTLLHLSSDANTTMRLTDTAGSYSDIIYNESASVSQLILDADPAGSSSATGGTSILLKTDGATAMTIDSSQRVGIGTTSPGQILEVVNNDNPAILLNNSSTDNSSSRTARFALNIGNTLAAGIRAQTTSGSDASDASLGFSAGGDATFSQMRILADGNVGIGTTNPSVNLHIFGTGSPALRIQDGDGTTQYVNINHNNGLTSFDVKDEAGDGEFRFRGAATLNEYLRIDSSGRLLVGTTSASTGALGSGIEELYSTASSETTHLLLHHNSNSGTQFANLEFLKTHGGNAVLSENTLGRLRWSGFDGSSSITAGLIECEVDGTPDANDMPGRLVFSTTADGASSPTERMRIDSAGQVLIAGSGTLSSPAIAIGGDVNSGLYSPGPDQLAISTNGTQRLLILDNGNININDGGVFYNAVNNRLGVGTASPGTKLHISGSGQPTLRIQDEDGTTQLVNITHNNGLTTFEGKNGTGDGQFRFIGGGTTNEFIRIDSSGRVGLGTSAPDQTLHVRGAGAAIRVDNSDVGANIYGDILSESGALAIRSRGGASTHGKIDLRTWDGTTDASRLFIDNDGKVGIGTTSPGQILDVNNNDNPAILLNNSSTDDSTSRSSRLAFNVGGTFGAGMRASVPISGTAANADLQFGAGGDVTFSLVKILSSGKFIVKGVGTEAFSVDGGAPNNSLIVDSTGKAGLGTSSPNEKLDISNGIIRVINTTSPSSETDGASYFGKITGGAEISHNSFVAFRTAAEERVRIDNSGRLLVRFSSNSGGALLQVNGDRIRVGTAKTPASASDTGTTGEICWDTNYVYVAVGTNTWKRAALSTW